MVRLPLRCLLVIQVEGTEGSSVSQEFRGKVTVRGINFGYYLKFE